MNIAILAGHLGADPEIRYSQGGMAIMRLRVATNERKKKGDAWEDHTEWHSVTVFGKRAESLGNLLQKGSYVTVRGRIETRQYEGKDGSTRYATGIVADDIELGPKTKSGGGPRRSDDGFPADDFGDDDVPF